MSKIKDIKYNEETKEIDYDSIKPYSVPLTPREPKKPFLQKAKEAAKTYYGTMLKPLTALLPIGCGDSGEQFCQLDKLGDNFSLDKPAYVKENGQDIDLMGANIKGTTVKNPKYHGKDIRGYSSKRKDGDARKDYIYLDESYAGDADGTLSKMVTLHELGHSVFDRPHTGGDIFTDPYYSEENKVNRYDENGCSLDIMDTLRAENSITNKCYEDNKEMYKEQFRQWIKEFMDIEDNKYKCANTKKDF